MPDIVLVAPDGAPTPWPDSPLTRRWTSFASVGGLRFVASEASAAAADLAAAALERAGGEHVHLANSYTVALADKDPALAVQAFAGGWNLPDGRPISVVSRLRRDRPVLHQVRGPQFFLDVCREGVPLGLQHYLLGGSDEVRHQLESALRDRFPGIRIVGGDSPPFRPPTEQDLAARDERIAAAHPHVVWVGLGTPKQDLEAARLAGSLPYIAVAVGAAFDYAAGTLAEAPAWMRRMGLEWVHRLVTEPRRLWRRYLFGNARFLRVALRR